MNGNEDCILSLYGAPTELSYPNCIASYKYSAPTERHEFTHQHSHLTLLRLPALSSSDHVFSKPKSPPRFRPVSTRSSPPRRIFLSPDHSDSNKASAHRPVCRSYFARLQRAPSANPLADNRCRKNSAPAYRQALTA